jgi:6,7-dimethyl-8-ribityllumazine synthase
MPRIVEGGLTARGRRFALVASRFNDLVVGQLIEGALECLRHHGAAEKDLTLVRVPGAFEIPQVARRLAESGRYDAIVCLGALIRGETPHFDFIAASVFDGISRLAEETGIPASCGVLTTLTLEQALERAGGKDGARRADKGGAERQDKGWSAALAAIELAGLAAHDESPDAGEREP